ncbi:MAG: oxygen-independent coproporphyrinogen III oxidase, partial [Cytophagales bacterium]|nr:oxygen-independent coproporphyrinogen III oxidase [Rhizobacter sp.]
MSEILCPTGDTPTPTATITPELLQRFDVAGPRYTSYPTADRFVEAFGATEYAQAARQRAEGALAGGRPALSVYVHIPFCESVCYYCACNKVVTRDHARASEYLDALEHEMALHVAALGAVHSVSQLHLGGGTPTFLSDDELDRLMGALRRNFRVVPGAELSIEVDPRTVSRERLAHLAKLGFNRLSFGVQDFDEQVQRAVHRVQPFESVKALVEAAREIGFESINVDLIYGLPMQTPVSFQRTVTQVNALRPDRIALYAYAHLPQRFKPQRRISTADIPPPPDRVAML